MKKKLLAGNSKLFVKHVFKEKARRMSLAKKFESMDRLMAQGRVVFHKNT
jgi:hypothetical protein